MADEKNPNPKPQDQNPISKIIPELLNSGAIKFLTSFLPGGEIIDEVIKTIVQYIETVEKFAAMKGLTKSGEYKKSIVVDATYEFLVKKFPEIEPFGFIAKWAIKEVIDFIVNMKNRFGWNWIPITNG